MRNFNRMFSSLTLSFRFLPDVLTTYCRILFTLLVITAAATPSLAQRYQVDTYTEYDGLPSSAVKSVAQDSTGKMWFATRAGIASYNCRKWVNYNLEDGLPTSSYKYVYVDNTNRVWAIADEKNRNISVFNGRRWKTIPGIPGINESIVLNKYITSSAVAARASGALILLVYNESELYLHDEKGWNKFSPGKGFEGRWVYGIEVVGEDIFLATSQGLMVMSEEFQEYGMRGFKPAPREKILSLSFDAPGNVFWLVGPDWIGRIKDKKFIKIASGLSFPSVEYRKLMCEPDGMGGLYLGNQEEVWRFDGRGSLELIGKKNGLIDDGATSLYRDREGNMWIGGLRGVSKIISLRFASYSSEHGLLCDEVTSILEWRSGEMVLGHPGGITILGDTKRIISFPGGKLQGRVLDLTEDTSGTLWAAASYKGLAKLDSAGAVEWYGSKDGLTSPVNSVLADRSGRIWVASGFSVYVKGINGFEEVRLPHPKFSGNVIPRKFFEGSDGAIYVATFPYGVYRLSEDDAEHWRIGETSDENNVFSLLEDPDGMIWVGTYAGLFRGKEGVFERVCSPGPAISCPVYFILRDSRDRTWFGTDNGVFRWNGKSMSDFTVEDGLIGRETNRDAGFLDSRGNVWIGTESGVSIYREEYDHNRNTAPLVSLGSLENSGNFFPLNEKINLKHGQNTIILRFNAISFINEKKILFRSWLEGFDLTWIDPSTSPRQEIRYTNLPPGEYIFHLQAKGYKQPWSKVVSSKKIVIHKPFWEQIWFKLLYGVGICLVLYGIFVLVSQRRYSRKLKSEVRENVTEMHGMEKELMKARNLKSLGVLAGGIAHDFNNFLTVVLGNLSLLELSARLNPKDRGIVSEAIGAVNRARSLTGQLLTLSRGGAPVIETGSIAKVVKESVSFVMRGSNVQCKCDLPDNLLAVEMDSDQISQVINNLLLNAQQAMPDGGNIYIKGENLEQTSRSSVVPGLDDGLYVGIEVKDQGNGISAEDMEHIFDPYFSTKDRGGGLGLTTAYSIVEKHKGLLRVESEIGAGATFYIYLPATEKSCEGEVPAKTVDLPVSGRILVMDDDESVLSILEKMLSQIGLTVELATDGNQAIKLYKDSLHNGNRFDVVLLDLTIPGGMGGEETIKHLIDIDTDIKAIAASGYSNNDIMANYTEYGFCARVNKPFTSDELKRVVDQAINQL